MPPIARSLRAGLCLLFVLTATCGLSAAHAGTPAEGEVQRNLAYGPHPRQRLDLYLPERRQPAPVIFLVHGGGWAHGDKAADGVVDNKRAHWQTQGYWLVSTNYRLIPDATPGEQVRDIARALAFAQREVAARGGSADDFILMGHSAGAHLVALLAASPAIAAAEHVRPWKATIALDSAAMDVPTIMQRPRHLGLYDRAFGTDSAQWQTVSPLHALHAPMPPLLAVCASGRPDACGQNRRFVEKARRLGGRAELLPEPLSHAEINRQLGVAGAYTQAVDAFIHRALRQR